MRTKRTRRAATTIVAAALAAVLVAACGSASSASSSTSGSRSAGASTARTKLESCLKQHGVTLPTGFGHRRPGGSGAHPPTGSFQGKRPPGGGFFGANGNSARFKKMRAALQACGANFGGAHHFGGPGGGPSKPSAAAVQKFSACVARHGYTLPKANLSGSGSIYPRSIEANKKFQAAARSCASDLRSSGRGPNGSNSSD